MSNWTNYFHGLAAFTAGALGRTHRCDTRRELAARFDGVALHARCAQ